MNSEVAILSPEKVILTYRLASIGNRILAHLVDLLLVGVLLIIEYVIITWLESQGAGLLGNLLVPILIPTVFLYFIISEACWNGLTVGKKFLGIRVRMIDGTPLTPLAALGRNLLRPADLLPNFYCFGMVCMVTTPKSQRFGDLAAGTCVFYEKRAEATFSVLPPTVGTHVFEEVIGPLRGMTREEFDALKRMCDRFPDLSTGAQNRLIKEVWQPISRRLSIPTVANVHPIYLAEAAVMKFGRENRLM